MASYDAVVNLNVVGTSRLNRVNASINELNKLTLDLNKSLNVLAPGAGKLGDKLRVAFEPIKNFARDATDGVAKFANTLSGAANQAQVFATVLENVKVKAGGFDAQVGNVKNLANAWVGAATNLTTYNRRLRELQQTALAKQGLMQLSSGEIALGTEAGFGPQGPKLPRALGGGMDLPEGVSRLAKNPGLRGAQGLLTTPGVADAIIGAGFPALFGGGPGAILGGGIGGLAGGALGGQLGMALSIGLSAVGQKLDEAAQKVRELGDALKLLNIDKLRDSFIVVNAELETTVRRLLEAGQAEAARAAMTNEVAAQTGALFSAIEDSANASNLLGNAWNDLGGSVSSLLSMLAAPFAAALAGIVGLISQAIKGVNVIVSLIGGGLKGLVEGIIGILPGGKQLLEGMKKAVAGTNEELEKQKAALTATTDTAHRQLITSMKLEQIDKQRTHAVTTLGKLTNIEADRQAKIVNIRAKAEEDIIALRLKYGNLTDAQSKKDLEIAIQKIQAQAELETGEANRAAARQKLVALNAEILEQNKLEQTLVSNQAAVESARSQAYQQILQAETQNLELRKQFALSLNQEYALINQIADRKVAAANESYAQTARELELKVQLATAELQSLEAAYKRGFATEAQVATAESNLQTAIATRNVLLQGAAALREQAVAASDVERRQQLVAAYAADAARQTEAFTRSANEATNLLDNQVKLYNAYAQATITVNNAAIQTLESALAQTKDATKRQKIILEILKLEIQNADVTLKATTAQIKAEVERQRIALSIAEAKYKELEAVTLIAKAQGVLTKEHIDALNAQKSAVRIAADNLRFTQAISKEQLRAAEATYQAAVQAAKLKAQTAEAAAQAERFANAMAGARQLQVGDVVARASDIPQGPNYAFKPVQGGYEVTRVPAQGAFATGGYVDRPTRALIGEAGPEYIIPRKKVSGFVENWLNGKRGESAVPSMLDTRRYSLNTERFTTHSTSVAPINIQTGPVMQMDGKRYVSVEDMEKALLSLSGVMFNSNRAAGTRRYTGVR